MRTTDGDLYLSSLSHAICSLSPNITKTVESTTDDDNVENASYFILLKSPHVYHHHAEKDTRMSSSWSLNQDILRVFILRAFTHQILAIELILFLQQVKMAKKEKKKKFLRKVGTLENSPTFIKSSQNFQALMTIRLWRDGHLKHQAHAVSSSSHGIRKCSRHEQCKLENGDLYV